MMFEEYLKMEEGFSNIEIFKTTTETLRDNYSLDRTSFVGPVSVTL